MNEDAQPKEEADEVSRRGLFRNAVLAATGAGLSLAALAEEANAEPVVPGDYRIENGRIRQSIMGWCFNPMPAVELAGHCKEIGLVAMEGIPSKFYPKVRELGLKISLVGSHGFAKGPFSTANHGFCIKKLTDGIDLAAEIGTDNVITFTGMTEKGITPEAGTKNCVDCWKKVIGRAEKKGVTLCLEHLNSRDDTHPMKGHPGYFGDDVDFCVDLIKRIDSPNMKLLFDIYHVQIMNGDVIRRIRQYKDVIAHIHTAGVPGRAELDHTQELNYPAIMQALLDIDYRGFVAQEFIPTWEDRVLALRHAAMVCDV
ncbi:MAG: TIM barrel protein [Planctomycetota bacterium]|nr:TIM barrel protein [Planctomycetota bacterium]